MSHTNVFAWQSCRPYIFSKLTYPWESKDPDFNRLCGKPPPKSQLNMYLISLPLGQNLMSSATRNKELVWIGPDVWNWWLNSSSKVSLYFVSQPTCDTVVCYWVKCYNCAYCCLFDQSYKQNVILLLIIATIICKRMRRTCTLIFKTKPL